MMTLGPMAHDSPTVAVTATRADESTPAAGRCGGGAKSVSTLAMAASVSSTRKTTTLVAGSSTFRCTMTAIAVVAANCLAYASEVTIARSVGPASVKAAMALTTRSAPGGGGTPSAFAMSLSL